MSSENVGIDYAAVLADLKAKRDRLDAAIAGIEAMLTATGAPSGSPGAAPAAGGSEVQPDSFFGMSIAEAAKKFLVMKKRMQTTQDIADALEKGGMTHTSGNWGNTVGSVLNRNNDFVRIKRGTWGLVSWYPGRKRTDKPKDGDSAEEGGEVADGDTL